MFDSCGEVDARAEAGGGSGHVVLRRVVMNMAPLRLRLTDKISKL